jgi:hypothetical protein
MGNENNCSYYMKNRDERMKYQRNYRMKHKEISNLDTSEMNRIKRFYKKKEKPVFKIVHKLIEIRFD